MILPMTPGLFPVPQVTGGYQTLGTAWNGLAGLFGLGDTDASDIDPYDNSSGDYYSGDQIAALPPAITNQINNLPTTAGSSTLWNTISSQVNNPFGSSSSSSPSLTSNNSLLDAIAANLTNTASSVLKAQFGQPNLAPGEYVNTTTGVAYRQPAGVAVNGSLDTTSLSGLLPILLLAGGAFILVSTLGKR